MGRLVTVDWAEASGKKKGLLDQVRAAMGATPNATKVLASALAALEDYLGFSGALGGGNLSRELRERISLLIAQDNGCEYCLSAHTAVARQIGLDEEEVFVGRRAASDDLKIDEALRFTRDVVERRGQVSNEHVSRLREAGYTDLPRVDLEIGA